MHFSASDPSLKMMMDLISSANYFCIVSRICDFLGKMRSTWKVDGIPLQLFLLQERYPVPTIYAAEHFSCCASMAESHLSATASPFENAWHADRDRSTAQGNTSGCFRTKRESKYLFDCETADCAEILVIWEIFQTRPPRNSAGMLSIPCGHFYSVARARAFFFAEFSQKGNTSKTLEGYF